MGGVDENEIFIVGGGICGLATALALHRKGIRSVVLERSESLRATGAAIGIMANGWRALDQLGVGSKLRQLALPVQGIRDIWLDTGKQREAPFVNGEVRCLKRSDLITVLADGLPLGTIRFGCHIVSVKLDPLTSYPILHLQDGSSVMAKVLIGCDGAKSVVADFLELKPTKVFSSSAVRGLTNYPNGHAFASEFVRTRRGNTLLGRIPIDDKSVHWFVAQQWVSMDAKVSQDSELVRQSTLESIKGFPMESIEMIETSDLDSLSHTRLRYRPPWDLLLGRFWKGTVTVGGDAMHVMGPFLGQGGSAGLEDAIVLARCLSQKIKLYSSVTSPSEQQGIILQSKVGEAMDQYVKERRMRVVRLSTQSFLTGLLLTENPSQMIKLVAIVFMAIFFRDPTGHARYDSGCL